MQVIPVLDILNGKVVRGVAGKRDQYRPITSGLAPGCDPLVMARAFRDRFGLSELYLADLDAILHQRRNRALYRKLADERFHVWVDAGLRDNTAVPEMFDAGVSVVIVALETSSGPEQVEDLCARFEPRRFIFSLDLAKGQPLGNGSFGADSDPLEIAGKAIASGIRRILVLDLASVGVGSGVSTLELCRTLRERHPGLSLITGGGVRGIEDLHELQAAGIEAALVASALHTGAIVPPQIRLLAGA